MLVGNLDIFLARFLAMPSGGQYMDGAGGDAGATHTRDHTMTSTTAHGLIRSLDMDATGINGSGQRVWMIYTTTPDGKIRNVERFTSLSEAVSWMKWA